MRTSLPNLAIGMAIFSSALCIELDLIQATSVDNAMATIAYDMMSYYKGNLTGEVPGLLPGPCSSDDCYYWWMAGGMWGTMIDYYQYTGDSTYQQTVLQALAFQIGPDKNYNPPNQSAKASSEDAVFWALAAMDALEAGVPSLDDGVTPSWLNLAEAVFEDRVAMWDMDTCGGGLRWLLYSFQAGYNLKTAVSTGVFFQLAARLAWHTGNSTYATWAEKAYDWMSTSALMETQNNTLYIWDNVDTNDNCTTPESYVWTYNHGTMMVGAAFMYNYTNSSDTWRDRVANILNGAATLFFPEEHGGNIMSEILCEPESTCNNDQSSFKAYTARWMAMTSILAPFTASDISPKLAASAEAAARQCSGGDNGRICGRQWYNDEWDGTMGVGQQMSALAVIGATRVNSSKLIRTSDAAGTSSGNNNSSNSSNSSSPSAEQPRSGGTSMISMLQAHTAVFACVMGLLVHYLL